MYSCRSYSIIWGVLRDGPLGSPLVFDISRMCLTYPRYMGVRIFRSGGKKMKLKGPEVVLECIYCGNMRVHPVEVDWFPNVPPLDLEIWHKAKDKGAEMLHDDGTPIEEGEVLPAICPKCKNMGMPESILEREEVA